MIRNVGGTEIKPIHRASCHCGAVVLELAFPDGIVDPFELGPVPTGDGVNHPADRR